MIGRVVLKKAIGVQGVLTKNPVRTMYPQQSSNVTAGMPRNRIPFPVWLLTFTPLSSVSFVLVFLRMCLEKIQFIQ